MADKCCRLAKQLAARSSNSKPLEAVFPLMITNDCGCSVFIASRLVMGMFNIFECALVY